MIQYKEIPILFSTDMVQAILSGRKTQTRRIVKPQPDENGASFMANAPLDWEQTYKEEWKPWKWDTHEGETIAKHCPYGMVGDVLWVRESFREIAEGMYQYKSTYPNKEGQAVKQGWKPSIHMPKDAARIWLRITGVRMERLQDITEADARQEGVKESDLGFYQDYLMGNNTACNTAKESFESLWQAINGNWQHNPWVWVISFEVLSTTGKPSDI